MGRIRQCRPAKMAKVESEDLASIDFASYIHTLTTTLFHSYEASTKPVALKLNVEDISLGLEMAIPCGLILNELVSNALKYAFPAGRTGELYIDLHAVEENAYVLTTRDNGVGFPPGVDFRDPASLGLRLVQDLTYQLEGHIELHRNEETEFRLKFPAAEQEGKS